MAVRVRFWKSEVFIFRTTVRAADPLFSSLAVMLLLNNLSVFFKKTKNLVPYGLRPLPAVT